jgi:hypothetical protein
MIGDYNSMPESVVFNGINPFFIKISEIRPEPTEQIQDEKCTFAVYVNSLK